MTVDDIIQKKSHWCSHFDIMASRGMIARQPFCLTTEEPILPWSSDHPNPEEETC